MAHNLGTYAEAHKIAPASRQTYRMWLQRKWIRAVRVGGKTLYDLDSVRAMVQPIGKLTDEERIAVAELIATSPDPTDEQVARVRQVLHSVQAGSD
jgi:hypothetical protein